ncbi:UDP-xylose transporter 3-like [Senna tora]|uniref:UDP-xylose transporter 3-like n=1 Tax=Senna tora TaxID=362788 RepID=A0A834TY17_9FABA|nr:UDP-xylose transporter 3-like [Senna tora]
MVEGEGFQLGTVGALSLSVVSSVSIVICNKALMSTLHFIFVMCLLSHYDSLYGGMRVNQRGLLQPPSYSRTTTLTSWHLLVTFCSLHVALKMKLFEHKPFEQKAVMGFGILNGISIGLLNLSLGFNSVGFYQMTKLAIIPCTILLETLFLGKKFSKNIRVSLAILLVGVGIATVTDLQLNALGSFLSFLAVITTCVAQIVLIPLSCAWKLEKDGSMPVFFNLSSGYFLHTHVLVKILTNPIQMTNTIQKKFKVSSTQLLYQSCPYQAATLLISGPFLDKLLTNQNVFAFNYTTLVTVFIVLSCLISISVNFSTFLVIGKTSPVTYQVLGHLKTCLVLAFGYILLQDPFNWRNIAGIFIALVGMILYSYVCTVENQQKAAEATVLAASQAKEGEENPLLNVENGNAVVLAEPVGQKPSVWTKEKD